MKMSIHFLIATTIALAPTANFAFHKVEFLHPYEADSTTESYTEENTDQDESFQEQSCDEVEICCEPPSRWYLTVKPGYYYFTDESMRTFFNTGGFTGRVEIAYQFWKPFLIWLDGGYFQKTGHAIGGTEEIHFKLATITLGLKGLFFFNDAFAFYAGAGPRVFMLMMHNDSPFVRSDDNAIGVGGGFDAGFLIFPWKNFYFDLFADYSRKTLKIEEDEISSTDSDIDVSGITAGIGLGIRF